MVAAHIGKDGSCKHVSFVCIIDHASVLIVDLVDDVAHGSFHIVAWFGDLFEIILLSCMLKLKALRDFENTDVRRAYWLLDSRGLLFSSHHITSHNALHVALLASIHVGHVLRVYATFLLLISQLLSCDSCVNDWRPREECFVLSWPVWLQHLVGSPFGRVTIDCTERACNLR